jgi:hypothetical protein
MLIKIFFKRKKKVKVLATLPILRKSSLGWDLGQTKQEESKSLGDTRMGPRMEGWTIWGGPAQSLQTGLT